MYKHFFKRFLDLIISVTIIIIIFPIFLIVFVLIKLDSKGPVFYTQNRLGKGKKLFKLFKFRSMTHITREKHRQIFEGDPEVTKVGSFLRRTKIDELPQLINIIKGDMSLVGPRPALPELLKQFNEDAHYRLLVHPGLTGWAQINGNIFLDWHLRWKFDRYYVENLSFLLDVRIILKTFAIVLLGENKYFKDII